MRTLHIALLVGAACTPVLAQSDIDPASKFCWQENSGWMNWRDAGNGQLGAVDRMTYLAGFVWSENLGWINLGAGPADSVHYANTSSADFGVNVAVDNTLSGFAWSENANWINFSGGALATPTQPARIDVAARRLRGYAWGENIGWINLDLPIAGEFVRRLCYANCDRSTTAPVLNANDFLCFMGAFAAGDPIANCDRSSVPPVLNANDFLCFMNAFANGCH